MHEGFVFAGLILLGLSFGSFVNALVWRLHENRDFVSDRSECIHCHHKLAWNDLIPVLSWLTLRGKCRYCRKTISWQYPVVELLVAILFIVSYLLWPYETVSIAQWSLFGLWLVFVVGSVALAVYDIRWMLLPDRVVFPLIGLGILFALVKYLVVFDMSIVTTVLELILGIASVGGVYYALYIASKGEWVGFGDVKLGVFMGVTLGWQAGLLAVILANVIGLLVMLPGLLSGKLSRTSRVPFGPFLIIGFLLAGLLSDQIIEWYLTTLVL